MENKHTPGPWRLEGNKIKGSMLVCTMLNKTGDKEIDEELKANINLILSATDLLKACEKVVNNWGNLHPKDRQQLRQAISKAKAK